MIFDPVLKTFLRDLNAHAPYLASLEVIFSKMDDAYDSAAAHYGFDCKGCADNCCETLFHHHTLLEILYLFKGVNDLDEQIRKRIYDNAAQIFDKQEAYEKSVREGRDGSTERPRLMCPLNREGLCILYAYRPMICRLHGIAGEMRFPGGRINKTPGCEIFHLNCSHKAHNPLDRTPHYMELAKLEKTIRTATGMQQKIKMTVSGMLVLFSQITEWKKI